MTADSIQFFKDNPFGETIVDDENEEAESKIKPIPIDSIFVLKEHEIVQAYNNSFEVSWKNICLSHKMLMMKSPNAENRIFNAHQNLKFKKEQFYKATR